MKTQEQVILEVLESSVEELLKKDVHGRFTDRIYKAKAIVLEKRIERQKDGSYLVQGMRDKAYLVNSKCECEDFTMQRASGGWCKHKISAKLYSSCIYELEKLSLARIPHLHYKCKLNCTHEDALQLCWQEQCPDPMDQLCEHCALRMSAAPDTEFVETEDLDDIPEHLHSDDSKLLSEPACINPDSPSWDESMAAPLTKSATRFVTEQYEPCPQARPHRTKRQRPLTHPMPEAPASLNLKLKLPGGHELWYTARSMKRGNQGDLELFERLQDIIQNLEELAHASEEHGQVSWFQKIMQRYRPERY